MLFLFHQMVILVNEEEKYVNKLSEAQIEITPYNQFIVIKMKVNRIDIKRYDIK